MIPPLCSIAGYGSFLFLNFQKSKTIKNHIWLSKREDVSQNDLKMQKNDK